MRSRLLKIADPDTISQSSTQSYTQKSTASNQNSPFILSQTVDFKKCIKILKEIKADPRCQLSIKTNELALILKYFQAFSILQKLFTIRANKQSTLAFFSIHKYSQRKMEKIEKLVNIQRIFLKKSIKTISRYGQNQKILKVALHILFNKIKKPLHSQYMDALNQLQVYIEDGMSDISSITPKLISNNISTENFTTKYNEEFPYHQGGQGTVRQANPFLSLKFPFLEQKVVLEQDQELEESQQVIQLSAKKPHHNANIWKASFGIPQDEEAERSSGAKSAGFRQRFFQQEYEEGNILIQSRLEIVESLQGTQTIQSEQLSPITESNFFEQKQKQKKMVTIGEPISYNATPRADIQYMSSPPLKELKSVIKSSCTYSSQGQDTPQSQQFKPIHRRSSSGQIFKNIDLPVEFNADCKTLRQKVFKSQKNINDQNYNALLHKYLHYQETPKSAHEQHQMQRLKFITHHDSDANSLEQPTPGLQNSCFTPCQERKQKSLEINPSYSEERSHKEFKMTHIQFNTKDKQKGLIAQAILAHQIQSNTCIELIQLQIKVHIDLNHSQNSCQMRQSTIDWQIVNEDVNLGNGNKSHLPIWLRRQNSNPKLEEIKILRSNSRRESDKFKLDKLSKFKPSQSVSAKLLAKAFGIGYIVSVMITLVIIKIYNLCI